MVYPVPYIPLKRLVVYCTPWELSRGLLPNPLIYRLILLYTLIYSSFCTLGARAQVSTLNIALFSVVSAYVLCFTDYTTEGF